MIGAFDLGVDLAQRDAVLPRHADTVLVFGREHADLAVTPAALAFHRPPRRLDCHRLALHLVASDGVTTDTQRARLAEQDRLQWPDGFLGSDHTEQDAKTILLHLD